MMSYDKRGAILPLHFDLFDLILFFCLKTFLKIFS